MARTLPDAARYFAALRDDQLAGTVAHTINGVAAALFEIALADGLDAAGRVARTLEDYGQPGAEEGVRVFESHPATIAKRCNQTPDVYAVLRTDKWDAEEERPGRLIGHAYASAQDAAAAAHDRTRAMGAAEREGHERSYLPVVIRPA